MKPQIIAGVGGMVIPSVLQLSLAAEVPFRRLAIDDSVRDPWAKIMADFNGDGAVDIAAFEMHQGQDSDEVVLFTNRNKGAAWDRQVLSTRGSHCIQAGDIGCDGDMDLIGANWSGPYQPVELWVNQNRDGPARR